LAEFSGQSALTVQSVLDDWLQFLQRETVDGEPRFSPYHVSFRDFLYRKDIVQAVGIDMGEIDGEIADRMDGELFGA
jgi:hypothetical protein